MTITDPNQLIDIQNFLTQKRIEKGLTVSRVISSYKSVYSRKRYYSLYYGKINNHDELICLAIAMLLNYKEFLTLLSLFGLQLNVDYARNEAISEYLSKNSPENRNFEEINRVLVKKKLKPLTKS